MKLQRYAFRADNRYALNEVRKIKHFTVFSLTAFVVFCAGCAAFYRPAGIVKDDPVSEYFIDLEKKDQESSARVEVKPQDIPQEKKLSKNASANHLGGIAVWFLIVCFGLLRFMRQKLSVKDSEERSSNHNHPA